MSLDILAHLDWSDAHIAERLLDPIDEQDRQHLLKWKAENDEFRNHLKTHEAPKA